MRQFFWYVFQVAVVALVYWSYIASNGWDSPEGANRPHIAMLLGAMFAMVLTGVIVLTRDWIVRRWRGLPDLPDDTPGVPRWRKPAVRLQGRIASSPEFRRAVEGTERRIQR